MHPTHWLISTQVNSKKLTPEKLLELDADQCKTYEELLDTVTACVEINQCVGCTR